MVQHAKISQDHISVYAPKAMKDAIVRSIPMIVRRNRVIMAAHAWMASVNIRACVWMALKAAIVRSMSMSAYPVHAKMVQHAISM